MHCRGDACAALWHRAWCVIKGSPTTDPSTPRPQRIGACWRAPVVVAIVAALLTPNLARAQFGLVTLPINDPAYVQLAVLERLGCAAARVSVDRPYQVRLVRAALVAARAEGACSGPILDALQARFESQPDTSQVSTPVIQALQTRSELPVGDSGQGVRFGAAAQLRATALHNGEITPLWENVRPTSEGDPPAVGVLHGRITYGAGDHLAIVVDGYGETNARNDPQVSAKPLRGASGVLDASEAYVSARAGVFSFTLGRGPEAWLGEGTDSPVLSANGPSYNRIAAAFNTAHFEGRALFGELDDVVLDSAQDHITSTIGPQRFYRYLVGHSLTWRPSRSIEVTAGETAVLPRGSQTVDFYYLNPFVPYLITAHDTGKTGEGNAHDNLTAFGAVRGRLGRVTASAELLIDDIQIDASRRANTPDLLGYVLTVSSPVPIGVPATVQLQYQRVDTYTYLREFYDEVLQYYNNPLASELGPDADYGRISGEILPTGWIRLAGDAGIWRRGLQRIYERPAQNAVGHPGIGFPSSASAQPIQIAGLAHAYVQLLTPALPITAAVTVARIRDANNLPVGTATYGQAQLYVTYAFRYP